MDIGRKTGKYPLIDEVVGEGFTLTLGRVHPEWVLTKWVLPEGV